MKAILAKCDHSQLTYISDVLCSRVSFTDDGRRSELLAASDDCPESRAALIELMDMQIRYFGSSDIAYMFRKLVHGDGGVSAEEIVKDVYKKLKLKQKAGSSLESQLSRLVELVVDKELLSNTPAELGSTLVRLGVGAADADLILDYLKKNGKAAALPILYRVLGPRQTLIVIQSIVVAILAQFLGREAAKRLVAEIIKRNPWLNALGPTIWVVSTAWLAFDLQGPAYRKIVPVCLALGLLVRSQAEPLGRATGSVSLSANDYPNGGPARPNTPLG